MSGSSTGEPPPLGELPVDDEVSGRTEEMSPRPPEGILPESVLRLFRVLGLAALAALFFESFLLHQRAGTLLRRAAEGNRVQDRAVYATRGAFLDRTGLSLVENVPVTQLVADPRELPDDLASLFAALAEALDPPDLPKVRERITAAVSTQRETVVLRNLPHERFLSLAARADRLPGVRLETSATRQYRADGSFAHVLGYLGKLSPEDRAKHPDYLLTEDVGKAGLELQYESLLRGVPGAERAEVDAFGSLQHRLGLKPPESGKDLRLNLDARLQTAAARALASGLTRVRATRGAVVGIDPRSGAVRILVSLPTFSHTLLGSGAETDAVEKILTDPSSPLLNRATQGQYVPGSSFKVAVAAAGLAEGLITPATVVESRGGIRVQRWFFPDWKAGGHGRTDLTKALAESVNTYFYILAGGQGTTEGLGITRLTDWARRLGFGEPTGIDLPAEQAGFLPTPEWKNQTKGEVWYIGDTYHAGIGQGDVLVTPLQLAVATATIANGGTRYAPRLLDAVLDSEGRVLKRESPVVRAAGVINGETSRAILSGMRAAVTEGSARGLSTLPWPVAAKTGTAQVGASSRAHAWVTVVTPADSPELVLVVLVEQAGGGETVAVPIAREILEVSARGADRT